MGGDGVLTSADYQRQQNIEAGAIKAPAVLPKTQIRVYRFRFANPIPGISNTTIPFMGERIKIKMIDGVYEPPKDWSEAKLEKLSKVIQIHGFENVSVVEKKKESQEKTYILSHPDEALNPKYTGIVTVKVGIEEQIFDCKENIVTTTDKKVYKAFLKKGWNDKTI